MNDSQKKLLNMLTTVSQKENRFLLDNDLKSKLERRIFLLSNFVKGNITVSQTLFGILPGFFVSQKLLGQWSKPSINPYLKLFVHNIAPRWFNDYPEEPIDILGYRWHYLISDKILKEQKYVALFFLAELIEEIIIKDQYGAKEFLNTEEPKIILDCGANIGIFSLWAYYLSPQSQIYAFEPTKSTRKLLEKNININSLHNNIVSHNLALGDRDAEIQIRTEVNDLGTGNSLIDSGSHLGKNIVLQKVQMQTIDTFVRKHNLSKVNFIKIDTEGYEKQILQGARETIKKFSPVIACSAYHLKGDKIEIPKLVQSINPNYHYKLLKRSEEDLIFWTDKERSTNYAS